ncbi:MAG TPA: DUF3291 domain-containing protein [Cytophagales bacterium]|nr:DUF3291 domain-containing protein [Cytophagales bacterium]HAA23185.1 DUF3291 domain-containing protein [Cytophagales bacterium]HAP59305.1 DUF3291 domain-containing protein [Cytophagales bacterium]
MQHHLALFNLARTHGMSLFDPIMASFYAQVERVNRIADSSPGFVWRLDYPGNHPATGLQHLDDHRILVNLSVWETLEALSTFVYQTFHADMIRRKKEWFTPYSKAHMVLWWIPEGTRPTLEEATQKLEYLDLYGPSHEAFTFRDSFEPQ